MQNNNNKIIQGLWVEGALSTMEQLSLTSFLKNGHEYHLYTYGDVKNIPEGVIVKDANEILSSSHLFQISEGWGKGSWGGGFSDLFRYHLLKARGGWWCDTDIICLKYFDFTSDVVIASSFEGEFGECANGCVLKTPQQSPFITKLCEESLSKDVTKLAYAEMGPWLVQKMVKELEYEKYVVPSSCFCPITWRATRSTLVYTSEELRNRTFVDRTKSFLRPFVKPNTRAGRITHKTYAVHLWNEIWRNDFLSKDDVYDSSCVYEKLKSRYF